jgi:hypothetical protein
VVHSNVAYCPNVVVGWKSDTKINKIIIVASSCSFISFAYSDEVRSNINQNHQFLKMSQERAKICKNMQTEGYCNIYLTHH